MNSWQKQRRNVDFLLKCMMIKRGSGIPKEDLDRLSSMIDKEEQEMIKNDKLGLRGSFHKRVLHNLSDDYRIKEYLEELEETDCRVSLDKQLGVIGALRDFFELNCTEGKQQ